MFVLFSYCEIVKLSSHGQLQVGDGNDKDLLHSPRGKAKHPIRYP